MNDVKLARCAIKRRRGSAWIVAAAALGGMAGGCDLGPTDSESAAEVGTVTSFHAAVPADFVLHRAREGGDTLKAPPTWKPTSTRGAVVLNLLTEEPRSSVNLVLVPAAAGETLDKTMAKLPEQLSGEFADFKQIRSDFIILNELPVGRIVYEASRGGFHGRLMQLFIIKAGRIHIFTYTADPENYAREYPTVEQVAASLDIGQ